MKTTLQYQLTGDYARHRQALQGFWERVNGVRKDDFFDSFYDGNPFGPSTLGLCYDGDKLVGTENHLPHRISAGERIVDAELGVDTLVDPEYRLFHGAFGTLCRLTLDALGRENRVLIRPMLGLSSIAREEKLDVLAIYGFSDAWYVPLLRRLVLVRRSKVDLILFDPSNALPDRRLIIHRGDFDMF